MKTGWTPDTIRRLPEAEFQAHLKTLVELNNDGT